MGKGDIKSRKGKISNGSYGNSRKRANNQKNVFSLEPAAKKVETKKQFSIQPRQWHFSTAEGYANRK